MRHPSFTIRLCLPVVAALLGAQPIAAQPAPGGSRLSLPAAAAEAVQAGAAVRRLSVDDAVALALEQNLGIQIERINPQIQDLSIVQVRSSWAPLFTTNLTGGSTDTPVTNAFAGGQQFVNDGRVQTSFGVQQLLPTGANYAVAWDSTRTTTTNFFNDFNPQLRSNLSFNVTQPLLRNWKIDNVRQQIQINERLREISDVNLRTTVTQTTRRVKNAYWDLVFARQNLGAQQQSLDLARRLLADNEKRVQIGTMAPIDIVEAQAEVARNQESVIVAEAAIRQAEDRLRALILDPDAPDFWTVVLEPSDTAPFSTPAIDIDAAVQRARASRTEVLQAKNTLQQNDISIQYLRNQVLPEVNASASYGLVGIGGTRLEPFNFSQLGSGGIPSRNVIATRGLGSVLGDVFTNAYPAWTFGVQIGYPIGTSASEANLAKARLQHSQTQTQLRNTELQVATEVRDAGRQVLTNRQRVDTSRVARELAERRLEAEEKKLAAGIQTSFFVFQAQRDLAQARTNEVKAILDYNKSLVDYEAVQEVPLR
ncbi:MAG: TolC family protein [Vicinamibacterales bacterium]